MSRFSRRSLATVALSCSALLTAALPSAASAANGPYQGAFPAAEAYALINPGVYPSGANDWTCQPTAAHPRPVVLVPGTTETPYSNFAFLSPKLKAAGFCVYSLAYGVTSTGPATGAIAASALELSTFVDRVLAQTGASKVDIVGHSQGGMMPRQYIKFDGGASKVASLVGISADESGTSLQGLATLGKELNVLGALGPLIGQGLIDQTTGSPFLTQLNAGGMTVPGIKYTAIATKYDEVVTPYTNSYITSNPAGASVTNIGLQNNCPTNFADHLNISYSARTLWFVLNALGAAPTKSPVCDVQLPLF